MKDSAGVRLDRTPLFINFSEDLVLKSIHTQRQRSWAWSEPQIDPRVRPSLIPPLTKLRYARRRRGQDDRRNRLVTTN